MTTVDFITELFFHVDEKLGPIPKHSQAKLYPSEVVTLALLYALKGCGQLAFWRWLVRDYCPLFPNLPHRTRLFRLFNSHRNYIEYFLADPSMIGVIDSYGIELLHPIREGRSPKQIGKKGKSNHRWIVGGKLCFLSSIIWASSSVGLVTQPMFMMVALFNVWWTTWLTTWSSFLTPPLKRSIGIPPTCACVSAVSGTSVW